MLAKVKLALRYSNSLFDDEVNGLIDACKNDLLRVGIRQEIVFSEQPYPVITHAVISYCKWQLNFQNRGKEWGEVYRELRQDIALDGDYRCRQR